MIVFLVVLPVFVAIVLTSLAMQEGFAERQDVRSGITAIGTGPPSALPSLARRLAAPGLRALGRTASRVTPGRMVRRLERDLAYAGSPDGWDADRVLAGKLGLLAIGLVLGATIGFAAGRPLRGVGLAVTLAAAAFYLPDTVLRARARAREQAIRIALPNTLDLLAISVQAGLGFDAALARVVSQTDGPLAQEINRLIREMQLGKSRSQALRDLGERSPVMELRSFIVAMVQADVFGISIGKVLEVQSSQMRIRRRQRAEEQAQKLPVKIVFPLVLCIFPALLVVLIGPSAISIYRSLMVQ